MTITILFRNGKELSVKCRDVETERNTVTGRIISLNFKGVKENKILYLDFDEIISIYRHISDENDENGVE